MLLKILKETIPLNNCMGKEEIIMGILEYYVINNHESIILELDRWPRTNSLNITKGTNCNALK